MTTAPGAHAPRSPRPGPRPGRRHRAPQPRLPMPILAKPNGPARPLSRKGICYAVRGGGESSSSRWKDLEAQPAAVRAHAVIGAEDAKIRQRLSQEQGAGEVQRVQRSDGLHGKRSLRALGDLPRQLENRPTSPGLGEDVQHGGTAHLVEQLLGDGAPDYPSRLDEGQARADDLGRITDEPMSVFPAGLLERPAEYAAAFGVEGQRSARSASSRV